MNLDINGFYGLPIILIEISP